MLILCAAVAVLKASPGEKDAVACKAVILIELSRFEEAVEHMDKHAANFKELSFEKVKCFQPMAQSKSECSP